MDNDDLKAEMREGFRETKQSLSELSQTVQKDHDVLLRLDNQFTIGFSAYQDRVKDHESRIRFLERVAFGMIAIVMVIQFVVSTVSKIYGH